MTVTDHSSSRILITGAAGRIGTAFRRHVADRYDLRLGVHHPERLTDPGRNEIYTLELSDLDSCQRACEGIDVVVHLGGSPSPRADFYEVLLDSNIKGPYNILRAAADQGCRRVVLASSVQAVVGYPLDRQVRTDDAVRPLNMYGVCKCFVEAAAHYFAAVEGLSCIAVRIGSFESRWLEEYPNARNLSTFCSARDMSDLLLRCVETPDVRFAIVHGVSNNRFKFLDLTDTRELLGYCPQDDAFARFTDLQVSESWLSGHLGRGSFVSVHNPCPPEGAE